MDHLPCEGTFSNFRIRLGENLYNEIFHVLVGIFHQLEMITFNILAHDGTLYLSEPWALRAGGLPGLAIRAVLISASNVPPSQLKMSLAKSKIVSFIVSTIYHNNLGSEVRVYTECPLRAVGSTSRRPVTASQKMLRNQELSSLPSGA
jgi:hypothetical protein